jgi:hypothetical protein
MAEKELSPEILEEKLSFGNWKVKRIKEYQINRLPNFIEPIKAELILKLLVEIPTSEAMNLMMPEINGIEKITLKVTEEELSILRMGIYQFSKFIDEKVREYQGTLLEPEVGKQKAVAEKLKVQIEEARGNKDA